MESLPEDIQRRTASQEARIDRLWKQSKAAVATKSLRQLMLRNKEYKKEINYIKALKALNKSRSENPAYKEAFNNSFIYDLKKKNPN